MGGIESCIKTVIVEKDEHKALIQYRNLIKNKEYHLVSEHVPKYDCTLFHAVCKHSMPKLAVQLMSIPFPTYRGMKCIDRDIYTPFMYVCINEWNNIALTMLATPNLCLLHIINKYNYAAIHYIDFEKLHTSGMRDVMIKILKTKMPCGIDKNNKYGNTLLMEACLYKEIEIADLILDMIYASDNLELLTRKNHNKQTALDIAIDVGCSELVKAICDVLPEDYQVKALSKYARNKTFQEIYINVNKHKSIFIDIYGENFEKMDPDDEIIPKDKAIEVDLSQKTKKNTLHYPPKLNAMKHVKQFQEKLNNKKKT